MGDPIEFARRNLSTFFAQQSDRFRFEGIIAHGANGVTFQVTEIGQTRPLPYAIPPKGLKRKRLRSFTPTELANSFKRMRISSAGSAVKVAVQNLNPWRTPGRLAPGAYRDDPPPVARRLAKSHPIARGPLSKGDFLAGLSGPVLVSVRAVVALAYPQGYEPDSSPRLERIPGPDVAPSRLVHGDLHSKNIMFGTTEPSLSEHRYFPIMKFIDLGCAQEEDRAVEENLADVAEVIYHVIIAQLSTENLPRRVEAKYKNISTYAVHISDEATTPIRNVDPDLIDLVCRSLAANVEDRPGLRDTLYRTSQAVSNKTGASYLLYETAESDRDIQQFLQEMIYDTTPKSSPPPTPPPSSPPPYPPPSDIQAPIVITISDS
ncbi:hypothetical protein NPX13_g865 [Xylaria arbuscula]|uniref:Uncharacterized protein n=1 Tax=Xylaria arbuscula TaxID=114810 RepID=A0A9W8TRN6_9PEZI|nr:hypothetical protein NPX13_g865 [Xylaria arbuscula]